MAKHHFSPKDRIDHSLFGSGTVVEANERHLSIAFDDGGKRKFITNKVELVRCDTPAPAKPAPKPKKKRAAKAS